MANKQQVIDLHFKHPLWTSETIADELGCDSAYVRATFYRNGLTLPKARPIDRRRLEERERCAEIALRHGRDDIAAEIRRRS